MVRIDWELHSRVFGRQSRVWVCADPRQNSRLPRFLFFFFAREANHCQLKLSTPWWNHLEHILFWRGFVYLPKAFLCAIWPHEFQHHDSTCIKRLLWVVMIVLLWVLENGPLAWAISTFSRHWIRLCLALLCMMQHDISLSSARLVFESAYYRLLRGTVLNYFHRLLRSLLPIWHLVKQ